MMRRLLLLAVVSQAIMLPVKLMAEVMKLDEYRGWKGCYEISNRDSRVILCPSAGGRILYFAIDGKNIIFENEAFDGQLLADMRRSRIWPDGGRFDIGPEDLPARMRDEVMMGTWSATQIDEYTVEMRFERENPLGVYVVRRIELLRRGAKLRITQTMTNYTDQPVARHYWGRVFCRGGGVVELPLDRGGRWGAMGGYSLDGAVEKGRVLEVSLDDVVRKIGTDSQRGWLRYRVDGLQITQRFTRYDGANYSDTDNFTTIFYSNEDLCELEPVSPTVELDPGESDTFKQVWQLKKID